MIGHQADGFTFELGGIHTAFLCHHRTPPVAIVAPLSKVRFY
jgi:hypothetical protein